MNPEISSRRSRLESAVTKLFTHQAVVTAAEPIGEHFRLVTLGGVALRRRRWAPGDIFQVLFSVWEARAYTPLTWDGQEGTCTFLGYLHAGESPGARWLASLAVGDRCDVFGPRGAVDLESLRRPCIFFGDETSFSTAAALKQSSAGEHDVELVFEVGSLDESRRALAALGIGGTPRLVLRTPGDAHLAEVERLIHGLMTETPAAHGLFTGRAGAIQHLYRSLLRAGIARRRMKNVPYWAAGKKGLE